MGCLVTRTGIQHRRWQAVLRGCAADGDGQGQWECRVLCVGPPLLSRGGRGWPLCPSRTTIILPGGSCQTACPEEMQPLQPDHTGTGPPFPPCTAGEARCMSLHACCARCVGYTPRQGLRPCRAQACALLHPSRMQCSGRSSAHVSMVGVMVTKRCTMSDRHTSQIKNTESPTAGKRLRVSLTEPCLLSAWRPAIGPQAFRDAVLACTIRQAHAVAAIA